MAANDSWMVHQLKSALWYLLLMHLWTAIASNGKVHTYFTELVLDPTEGLKT